MRLTDEVRVGMIASLGVLLLVVALIFLRGHLIREPGNLIEVVFGEIAGLKEGADVQMAGVSVGTVEDVGLTEQNKARVRIRLHPHVVLPDNAYFTIGTRGLLGEPFVRIGIDLRLRLVDVKDPQELLRRLKHGATPLALYLQRQLPHGLRQELAQYDETKPPSRAFLQTVVDALNRIIETRQLFDAQRLKQVKLPRELWALVQRHPQGEDRVRLNRLLLEQACPGVLARCPKAWYQETVRGAFHGKNPVSMEDLVPKVAQMMDTVQAIADDARGLLSDPQLTKSLHETAANVASITDNVNRLLSDPRISEGLAGTLMNAKQVTEQAELIASDLHKATQGLGAVTRILENVEGITGDSRTQVKTLLEQTNQAVANLTDTTDAIRWLMQDSGMIKEQIPAMVESGRKTADHFERMTANLEQLTGNQELQQGLLESVSALKETLDNVKEATASLKDLVGDAQVHDDLKATIASTRETMAHAEQITEKVDNVLGATGDTLAALGRFKWQTDFQYRYLPGDDRFFADLRFNVWPSPKNYFRLGIHDFSERDKIELQAGSFLSPNAMLRFGLVRAKIGAGLDYRLNPRTSLSAELYDPNEPAFNLWGRYQVNKKWSALMGVEDLGHRTLFGLGVRFSP